MGEAVELEYTENMKFRSKKFSFSEIDIDAVYLSDQEIQKLYKFELKNKTMEKIRDLFVFGCYVGLRYSDYSNVKPENIIIENGEYYIKLITQKSKELVYIPYNPVVLDIFTKYSNNPNKLPATITEQAFNRYIKKVMRMAELRILAD